MTNTIVVGIDGSEPSKQALRWAVEEARLRGGEVEVVCAWQYPALALTHYHGAALPIIAYEDLEKAADELLWDTLLEVLGGDLSVPVRAKVVPGQAADVLMHEAAGADLLVVGARGMGGFASLLLGSVSSQVAHHATIPVVIVPAA